MHLSHAELVLVRSGLAGHSFSTTYHFVILSFLRRWFSCGNVHKIANDGQGKAMTEQRQKTISYHRAEFYTDERATIHFGLCLRQATDKLKTVSERSILRAGGYLMRMAQHRPDPESKGHFVHLTFETPGEHTSIVPSVPDDAQELKVGTLPPPNNAEFMDGDAFLYVNKDDVCLCTTAISMATVERFFQAFFEKAKIRKDSTQFELLDATDTHKYALIKSRGVKEIEIKASMYEASASYISRKNQVIGALGHLTRHIRAILGSQYDLVDDSLRVGITFAVDKRRKGSITLGHKRMDEMARNIIGNKVENDRYTIILEGGEKITQDDLVLRRQINLDRLGKSVVRDQAWSALFEYYQELLSEGHLDR